MTRKQGLGIAAGIVAVSAGTYVAVTVNSQTTVAPPNTASWSAKCSYVKPDAKIDPIVFPGATAAHMHSFFGGTVTPNTTTAQLRARTSNSCPVSVTDPTGTAQLPDNSIYWMPTLFTSSAHTTAVKPAFLLVYYRNSSVDPLSIQPMPINLAMVGGDPHAMQPQSAHVGWLCISKDDLSPVQPTIPTGCPLTGTSGAPYQLKANIVFPNCWNGDSTPASNWTSRMTYAVPNPDGSSKWAAVCPAGYKPIPSIQMEVRWNLTAFPAGDGYNLSQASLASDDATMGMANGQSLHGDFMNGWTKTELGKLVTNCYHVAQINCGAFGHGNL